MSEIQQKTWRQRYGPALLAVAGAVLSAVLSAAATYLGFPQVKVEIVEKPVAIEAAEYAPTFGWYADEDQIAANLNPARTLQFAATPAGKAALGDDDVFLWQAVRKVNNKGPPWYPNVNQRDVGCCVGCAYKHCADVCLAVQVRDGRSGEWKPMSVEAIYGLSRVEVGGGRISGDGSVGAWAKDAATKYGFAPMAKYESADLTVFSPTRAREFGRKGVPDDIEKVAKQYPVKNAALVKSWADVSRAVRQGYPVAVCSDRGFRMERDATGRCKPQGTWNHAMSIIGVRGGENEGGFILNSWGDSAHTGPVWPADAPAAGFWADADVIDRMVRQGDSFALSDMDGFPVRRPNFFIVAPAPQRQPNLNLFALAW